MLIDAHVHYPDAHPDLLQMLSDLEVLALNISFANVAKPNWRAEADRYRDLAQRHPQHFRWCTTFGLPLPETSDYAEQAIAGLDADFAAGAVACKIWKSYGMELKRASVQRESPRSADGQPIFVDDPVLAPIFEHMARAGYPLLMHIGDPLAAWLPLDHPSPHQTYYRQNPEWHMAGKAGFPTHAEIIAARDRMLANHPNLTVVGAHLGSLEHDVAEVAARLDRYPHFHVDISARLADLMQQDTPTVREFFHRYQDRILFGTDIVLRQPLSQFSPKERTDTVEGWRATYHAYRAYLESEQTVNYREYSTEGLALPASILDKVYRENARHVYRGL